MLGESLSMLRARKRDDKRQKKAAEMRAHAIATKYWGDGTEREKRSVYDKSDFDLVYDRITQRQYDTYL